MSSGIAAWGTYLPFWRLQRAAIAGVLGSGGGQGTRTVASHDEDTTTLGVEAGRRALAVGPGAGSVQDLFLSTPDPGYLDKTSATTVHAALGLGRGCGAYDFAGSSRSAVGTLLQALGAAGGGRGRSTLAILSDLRTGLAGSAEERDSGDGAAAFVCAPDGAVAELAGRGTASDEFLDRWRVPGEADSHVWEERFGEELYVPLAREAFAAALKDAGLAEGDVDHAVVTGLHVRAVRSAAASLGVRDGVLAPDLTGAVGNLGAAHAGVALCDVLERAEPGQVIVVLSLADGADALVLRTTDALVAAQRARVEAGVPSVADQVAAGRDDLAVRDVPDLAGAAPPGAAPPARSRATRCPDRAPLRGMEVRASWPAGASCAASATCRPPGPACPATPSTRCRPSAWPTCRGRWPPSPSTTWPSASRRPSWASSSTSTAAAATAARSPTSWRRSWPSATGSP